jgi:sugar phosphate isomerase/epimerase
MRLCWNDWFGGPIRDMDPADARELYNMGWRVAGINAGDADATDDDIARARGIINDAGLMPGPYGAREAVVHVDPTRERDMIARLSRELIIAGKLGCTSIRYSVGSMHPDDIWLHHPDNFTQRSLDRLVENTRKLVPVAEDAGCMLCPETTQFTIVHNIRTMKEYIDRVDSPYCKIIFDPVNHTNPERLYDTGTFVTMAIAELGDRIGVIHVKDVTIQDTHLVIHIDEAKMGTGEMDHAALMKASNMLEPWKTFSLEHIGNREWVREAYNHIQGVADRIGHTWSDPNLTRERWTQHGERGRG